MLSDQAILAGFAAAIAIHATAMAQLSDSAPTYGELALRSGSISTVARAGGAINAGDISVLCTGFVSEAPSIIVNYEGSSDLYLSAGSDEDTTLIVQAPDGLITCDDDSAGGLNPGVHFVQAEAGSYRVWLGTFSAGRGYPLATLHASTEGFRTDNVYTIAPDPDARPDQRLRLRAGFSNDPREVELIAGGEARLDRLSGMCSGYSGDAADLALNYRAGDLPLFISMQSDLDGVLAIQTPSGQILCNDDMIDLDPGIHISDPERGVYLIWAGVLGDTGATAPATLAISEIGFNGVDSRLDLAAPSVFGSQRLDAGFSPDPISIQIEAGGQSQLQRDLGASAISEGPCRGNVTRQPTYELDYRAGDAPLYISSVSETDTVLAVNTPDGIWHCDDDSGGDFNPSIRFNQPIEGIYDIYVGTFFDTGNSVSANLYISEIGHGGNPANVRADLSLPAIYGDHVLEAGFLPDPYVVHVQAGGPLDADESGVGPLGGYCAGHVTAAPSVELNWNGDGDRLSIYVQSDADTTLAVNTPDGVWHCNDDGGEDLNAALSWSEAPDGVYDIYVGTFGDTSFPARLNISELGAPD